MSWDLVLRHCATIRATIDQAQITLQLAAAQLAALEGYAKKEQQPRATVVVPEGCRAYKEEDCGRVTEEAVISNGKPGWAPMCRGCGKDPTAPLV